MMAKEKAMAAEAKINAAAAAAAAAVVAPAPPPAAAAQSAGGGSGDRLSQLQVAETSQGAGAASAPPAKRESRWG
jgi:hypothetical protein